MDSIEVSDNQKNISDKVSIEYTRDQTEVTMKNASKKALFNYLNMLHSTRATCEVEITSDQVKRSISFLGGQIVFAGSTIIDERLGEVIYRKGLISQEDWVKCASMVGSGVKFGRILVSESIFSEDLLVTALEAQAKEIVKCMFCGEKPIQLSVKHQDKLNKWLPFSVSTKDLILQAYLLGELLGNVRSMSHSQTRISAAYHQHNEKETFAYDFYTTLMQADSLESFLSQSNLNKDLTLLIALEMWLKRVIDIQDLDLEQSDFSKHADAPINEDIRSYSLALESCTQAFAKHGTPFPKDTLKSYIDSVSRNSFELYKMSDGGGFDQQDLNKMRVISSAIKDTDCLDLDPSFILNCTKNFILYLQKEILES